MLDLPSALAGAAEIPGITCVAADVTDGDRVLDAIAVASEGIDEIDLWELNEAFASQAVYCRDRLRIDPDKYNVNGGAISIGHPYGTTGARSRACAA